MCGSAVELRYVRRGSPLRVMTNELNGPTMTPLIATADWWCVRIQIKNKSPVASSIQAAPGVTVQQDWIVDNTACAWTREVFQRLFAD